ncbi:hypothetical protein RND81_05G151300 [Saponaria officinalis]|uniref:XS domain-containing protein n=1 Tax=Saponaria officinalis TaxID=3572 RepID=A0AAW1KYF0_SAPOF
MAGDNPKGGGSRAAPPSSSKGPSRWDNSSSSSKPSPKPGPAASKPSPSTKPAPNKPNPNPSPRLHPQLPSGPQSHPPFPFNDPPPPPIYGFHMLDRRTIVLADGSVRSYFALPPDYQDFPPPSRFGPGRIPPFGPMSPDGFPENPMKRKFGEDRERDEFARQKQQLLQYGNAGAGPGPGPEEFRASKAMRFGGGSSNVGVIRQEVKIDPAIMKAFLNFVKLINENVDKKKNFLDNGKHGPLHCLACGGSSKDFPDVHSLVMHAYNSDKADSRVEHLGLHRALCALMGWNCMRAPDNSRGYQFLPADEAAAFQDDLIMWPPTVIIHNTYTGKGKDGRLEGLGNMAMDIKLRDLGFSGGKSKSLYNRAGHLGVTLIKFNGDQLGLKEAMRLSEHFEKDRHGRKEWTRIQALGVGLEDENNPNIVTRDGRTGEKSRILYGYLLTAFDLDKIDYDTRKKVVIKSKLETLQTSK